MKSETKHCKYCQSQIPYKAKVCPVCKRKLHKPVLGIIIAVIGILILIGFANGYIKETTPSDSTESTTGAEITLSEFDQIETGMSYEDVVAIIGSEGELLSTATAGEITTSIFVWYGKDGISNANVTFSNNAVMAKAQIGLE